uniref:Major sperm protein n=1 Tax=Ditylenchus dipsaci TaxID=166011 RepID=A0A915E421_9BILA
MSRQQQILVLDPNTELSFKGPFTECVTSNLRLTNPSSRSVFFKVKTTAPRYYCVRPNSGIVKPEETAVINVMLQPVEQPATLENERARHKFMIQTAFAPDEEVPVDSFGRVWTSPRSWTPSCEWLVTSPQSAAPASRNDDQALQKEIDLRKMYQDEKSKLERENMVLMVPFLLIKTV